MKTTNQIIGNLAAVLAIAALFVGASAAHSEIITLSGGDSTDGSVYPSGPSGQGYQPGPVEVYADYFTDVTRWPPAPTPSDQTIQNVVFKQWDTDSSTTTYPGGTSPNDPTTVTAFNTYSSYIFGGGNSITGSSPNDDAMNAILAIERYAHSITFTFGGLTIGRTYQVDALINPNSGYTEDLTFTGATTATDNFTATAFNSYDVVETLKAVEDPLNPGSGEITLSLVGGGTTAINAYSLTAFLVPEPASMGLLGVGGLLLLKRRRGLIGYVTDRPRARHAAG